MMTLTAALHSHDFTTGETFNPCTQDTFAPVPNWLMRRSELSPGAKLAYGRLSQYAGKSGAAFPKLATLAAEIGVSESQARRYVRELESHNLIQTVRRGLGRSNQYIFLKHIWMIQAEKSGTDTTTDRSDQTRKDRPSRGDRSRPAISEHSHKKENIIKKKNDNGVAVVSSLPDDKAVESCLELIPDNIERTDGIIRTVKAGIARHGVDVVRRNIGYCGERTTKIEDFRAYLGCAIRGDYGVDWTPPAPEAPAPPRIELKPGALIRWTDGQTYRLDRGGFLFVGGGAVAEGTLRAAIRDGGAMLVDG